MKKLLLILFCLPLISYAQYPNYFKESYKSSKQSNKNTNEYYDEESKTYSNFKYAISYKEVKGWEMDMGVSEHTILRAYQPDSGHTFVINVIELDIPKEEQNMDSHILLNQMGEQNFTSSMKQKLFEQFRSTADNVKVTKTYFKNLPAIKWSCEIKKQDRGEEWTDVHIFYQVIRGPFTYTIGLITMDVLYEYDKYNLEKVFDHITFLYLK